MKTVLFVNDNEVLCRLTCDILRLEGYRAVPAYNAAEALKVFDEENFDIVVTDVRMQGMGGLELARAIHNKNPQLPVILVTAYGACRSRRCSGMPCEGRAVPEPPGKDPFVLVRSGSRGGEGFVIRHVKIVAALYIALGGLGIIATLIVFSVLRGVTGLLTARRPRGEALVPLATARGG